MAQLSSRYAAALFELCMERGMLNEYLEQAVFLCDTLREPECQKIITHPKITVVQKRAFFKEAFEGKIHEDIIGFLTLTVEKNREKYIIPALSAFIDLANNELRRTKAEVVSAVPLKPEQVSAIASMLSRKLNKQVEVIVKVDTSIIGGLFIQVDGYYFDRTIKNRLGDIKNNLLNREVV